MKPSGDFDLVAKKDLIPSIDELKALCLVKKEDIIKEIVKAMKTAALLNQQHTYVNFPKSSNLNKTLAEEIEKDFANKGYFVTIFEDKSYNCEGISFTIVWN